MRVLVCGGGGFIGSHLVTQLKRAGHWVRAVDLKLPEFRPTDADEFLVGDLRNPATVASALAGQIAAVYQLAAEMGGAGYIFTGTNDFAIMHNSALINLNVIERAVKTGVQKLFFASSACIYPQRNQLDAAHPVCSEDSAYPADPDSEYGWEKLFSERLYLTAMRNHGIAVHIARYHNIFGPEGTWQGGREKAPSALCRKVAACDEGGAIEIWGDGEQTRSFLYIDECIAGTMRLMESNFAGPVNIGSEEMVTINDLARSILRIAAKSARLEHTAGPTGVRGRNSDNRKLQANLGWAPSASLDVGLTATYQWVAAQVTAARDTKVDGKKSA